MQIQFTVHGTPQPQGSAKAFVPKGWNRAIVTSANPKNKPWRQDMSAMAQQAMVAGGHDLEMGAVRVTVTFWFSKPKSTKKSVVHKITKPDSDKLLRSVLDSMSGVVFKDDSQVVECHVFKSFADPEGARITVESLQ